MVRVRKGRYTKGITLPETNMAPEWMIGILVSFLGPGLFSGDPLSCARVVLANEDVLVQQSSKALEMWQVTNPLPLRLQLASKERQGILTLGDPRYCLRLKIRYTLYIL